MAVNLSTLQTAVQQSIEDGMSAYSSAIFAQQGITVDVDYSGFAAALAPAIVLAVQTILDDAEVSVTVENVTTGVDTASGTGTLS